MKEVPCPACDGGKEYPFHNCETCKGRGLIDGHATKKRKRKYYVASSLLNIAVAKRVADRLRRTDRVVSTWHDDASNTPAKENAMTKESFDSLAAKIRKEISQCDALLLLIDTHKRFGSIWEAGYAEGLGKQVFVFNDGGLLPLPTALLSPLVGHPPELYWIADDVRRGRQTVVPVEGSIPPKHMLEQGRLGCIKSLRRIQRSLCCYDDIHRRANPPQICDCKFGLKMSGESTGCPEMRELIGFFEMMTDEQFGEVFGSMRQQVLREAMAGLVEAEVLEAVEVSRVQKSLPKPAPSHFVPQFRIVESEATPDPASYLAMAIGLTLLGFEPGSPKRPKPKPPKLTPSIRRSCKKRGRNGKA